MSTLIGLVVGGALIAVSLWVFWRIDRGISPGLRKVPAIDAMVVLVVLGGSTGGAALFLPALISMFLE